MKRNEIMSLLKNNTYESSFPAASMCGCIGPQNGEPLCPCRMRQVTIKDGRYVEVIDHGPVE